MEAANQVETLTSTRELVMQAADALFKDGIRPTVANIRKITQRGSATTINQALHEWWYALSERITAAESRPDIPEPVFQLASDLWTKALHQADHTLNKERKALNDYQAQLDHQLETALFSQQAAETRATDLAEQLDQAQALYKTLETAYTTLQVQEKQAQIQIKALQDDIAKRQSAQQEKDTAYQKAQEREQQRYDALEKRLLAQLAEARQETQTLKTEFDQLQKTSHQKHSALEDTVYQLTTTKTELSRDVARLEQKHTALAETLSNTQKDLQSEQVINTQLKKDNDALVQRLQGLTTENVQLEKANRELTKATQKHATIQASLKEQMLQLNAEKVAMEKILKQFTNKFQSAMTLDE